MCNPLLKLTSKTHDWNVGRLKRPFNRTHDARISNYIIGNVSCTFSHSRLFVSRSADDFQRWLVFTRPMVVRRISFMLLQSSSSAAAIVSHGIYTIECRSKLHPTRICICYCMWSALTHNEICKHPRRVCVYLRKRVAYATLDCHAFRKRDQEIKHGNSVLHPEQLGYMFARIIPFLSC